MNNAIISLGCSFLAGVGNWDTTSVKKWQNKKIEQHDMHSRSYKNFLNYSIGTQLARNLNFDEHHNFAIGGSSIKHQLYYFYERYKPETFKDKNVIFYFAITYPNRNCTFVNNTLTTIHLDEERNNDFYQKFGDVSKKQILKDTIMNQIVYINSIRTLCKLNNWFLVLHPMVQGMEKWYEEKLGNNNPNEVWVDKWLVPFHNKYLAHCGHPNTNGYKIWTDNLTSEYINQLKFEFPKVPNTKTIYCKDYHEDTEIEAKRNDITQNLL